MVLFQMYRKFSDSFRHIRTAYTQNYLFLERLVLPLFIVSINRIKIKDLPQLPLLPEILGLQPTKSRTPPCMTVNFSSHLQAIVVTPFFILDSNPVNSIKSCSFSIIVPSQSNIISYSNVFDVKLASCVMIVNASSHLIQHIRGIQYIFQ